MIQSGVKSNATAAEARQLFKSLASSTPVVRFGRNRYLPVHVLAPPPPPPPG